MVKKYYYLVQPEKWVAELGVVVLIRAIRSQVFQVGKTHAIGHLTGVKMITGEKGDERFNKHLPLKGNSM
jgi:hypothetical protein